MRVYVFGNPDLEEDNKAINAAREIKSRFKNLNFVEVRPNEDLPFIGKENVIIMDSVEGIKRIRIIREDEIDKIKLERSVSVHDWDLGFQLKYLKKIGKIKKFTIIGLPKDKKINYLRIQSILRKLVAQDMQGS